MPALAARNYYRHLLLSAAVVLGANSSASAGTEQVLWSFPSPSLGSPLGRLLLHGDQLYGTGSGYDSGNGQLFRLQQSSGKWVQKSVIKFDGTDGSVPFAGLLSSSGSLYGTTAYGGGKNCGVVFSASKSGGKWLDNTIWSFADAPSDGCNPASDLVMDTSGNIFGTTVGGGAGGGSCSDGCGTVFELSPKQGGGWTETILYSFTDASDGALPRGGLFMDKAGNLFGTTSAGGGSGCLVGCGTVFELSPGGGGWSFSTIHNFKGRDGGMPWGVLIEGSKGTLYGTTTSGGATGAGTVFALKPTKSGWDESVLYDFQNLHDGGIPEAALTSNGSGGFYGTTSAGGSGGCADDEGCGVVFELTQANGVWSESVVYTFSGGSDGASPVAAVILDKNGNLYSTTYQGGASGYGTVWEIMP